MILIRILGSGFVGGTIGASIVDGEWGLVTMGIGFFLWMTYLMHKTGEFNK